MRTLNLGCNKLGDQGLMDMIPGGLEHNRSLHNLGLQANNLTCCAIISLAESLASGTRLHRVDLRKNAVQLAGLMALAAAMKLCPTVTCLDLNVTSSEVIIILFQIFFKFFQFFSNFFQIFFKFL